MMKTEKVSSVKISVSEKNNYRDYNTDTRSNVPL